MACSGQLADAQDWAQYWCVSVDDVCEAQLNRFLRMSAMQIYAAMQAGDQCDCSLAAWATDLLKQLNCIIGAAFYRCPCAKPALSVDERRFYAEQANDWLEKIRTGQIELCSGETGADYPAVGWSEQGVTEFTQAEIIVNAELRNMD